MANDLHLHRPKTLYVSDMDGTLLLPGKTVGRYTRKVLNRLIDKDHLCFSVATARSIATVYGMLEGIRISAPVVLLNGVCLYDLAEKRYIDVCYFPAALADRLLTLTEGLGINVFAFSLPHAERTAEHGNEIIAYYRELLTPFERSYYDERLPMREFKRFESVASYAAVPRDRIIYFSMTGARERMRALQRQVEEIEGISSALYVDRYDESSWFLEFFPAAASKTNGVRKLARHVGAERIVSFGDNYNDLGMFSISDECYAVANAIPEAEAAASGRIDSNKREGVARFLAQRKARGLL